jgi:hypothetical protein
MTQDDDGGGGDGYGAGARGRSSTPAVPASSPLVRSGKWNEGRSSEEDRDKKGQAWDIDMAARGILCSIRGVISLLHPGLVLGKPGSLLKKLTVVYSKSSEAADV